MRPAAISDYRRAAERRLPRFLFDYIDGGAYDEVTLARNIADLRAITLRQRVLQGVGEVDLSTTLLGKQVAMPVVLGPVGLAGLAARRGECQAVRAADAAGVPFTLSTVGVCSIAEVKAAARAPFWFQLYLTRDRGFVRDLLAEARAAGCGALVFTVDIPLPGARYRDQRSGLTGAPGLPGMVRRAAQAALRPDWAWDVGLRGRPHALGSVAPRLGNKSSLQDFLGWTGRNFDSGIGWRDLDFVRAHWPGPLIIKGVLDPEDAREAAALGAEAIIVSNHGGRQLDGALSTARALPAVVEAVGDRLTVLADGGVRSGLDVLRLLALGARGVLLGRAWAYALAAGGEAGVAHMLQLVRDELRVAMTLTGVGSIDRIDRSILAEVASG